MVVESEMEAKIKIIQEWIKENRHLPQKIGKNGIKTQSKFIYRSLLFLFVIIYI